MSSYNRVGVTPSAAGANSTPSAASAYLNDILARETFGFDGYFTSDCDAVFEIVAGHHWQPPSWTRPINNLERNAFAMSTGEDLDCNAGFKDNFDYLDALPTTATQQIPTTTDTFNVNDVDTSLVRLFTARMKLGEFDDPATVPWVTQARARVPQGTWQNSNANNALTETQPRLDLAREAGDKSIVLLKNAGGLLPLKVPTSGPFKVAVMGYFAHPTSMYLGGYSSTQGAPGVAKSIDGYTGIKNAIQAINPDAVVTPVRGFTGNSGSASGLTAVDPAAVADAPNYDAVVVYIGTDSTTATEDRDRTSLSQTTAVQASLAQQVAAANPNTIVYMETIGPVDVSAFKDAAPAILWSSYNGQRKGDALADVLLGAYDPSARLPSTWYAGDAQLPSITDYAIRPSATSPGRTYQYFTGQAAYPFGYGQSYTTFAYSNLRIDKHAPDANDTVNVTFDVKNTGTRAGSDVAELYVNQPDAPASAERPVKRLEGFQQVALDPGQTKTVTLAVKVPDLAFYDASAGRWAVDDGRYGIQVSRSAADQDIQLQDTVNVTGAITPTPSVVTAKPVAAGDAARDVQSRVYFPVGTAIDPQLTVSMNDDTLYGYIEKGQSKPLPAGLQVSYASNRPGVVAVDSAGAIRTVSEGVATVTATVTYHGVTKTASFVVDAVAQLSGITVNGAPLTALAPARPFASDWYSYDVVLPAGVTTPPVVAATSADPAAAISVAQAATVPGTATVTSTGADGTSYTYTLNFAPAAASDEFEGSAPGPQWTLVRPDTTKAGVSGGAFTITPQTGDIQGAGNNAKNLLLQPAPGDWTLETKLSLNGAPATGQQAGILAYQDDNDWLRFDYENRGGTVQLLETSEDASFNTFTGHTFPLPYEATGSAAPLFNKTGLTLGAGNTLWLKLVKRGQRYASYYSTDGSTWTFAYEVGQSLTNVKAGLFALSGTSTSTALTAAFDYARFATSATAQGGVGGSVPATLALSLGATPATFGAFTPGVAQDYTASTTADVLSTAGDATLSVSDPDTAHPGHLVNGAFALPSALQASASSPAGAGSAPANVGGASSPTTLLTYAGPVSHDPVAVTFRQHIGANDPLRTGSYSKTLTFTLSTTNP
jgi:beta-glucosidase